MYLNKTVAVVVPAYNEGKQIEKVLGTMPEFVDKVIVINDASSDNTSEIVREASRRDGRVELVEHQDNQGVGAAIVTGYKRAVELGIEVTAVMAGDGQMDPKDLPSIVEPIASGNADYTKGNRLFQGDAWTMIPHHRYLGNSFFLLTKMASGYWHIVVHRPDAAASLREL
jgi:glycosyltransferase involved in cell wall biosynthesis